MLLFYRSIKSFLLSGLLVSLTLNAQALTGTLVVVNKKADTVSFIDIASRKLKYTRNTGKGPHELAMSRDGKWAVVTNYVGGNSLTVFDVAHAKVVRTIDLHDNPRPHGILFLKIKKE